jgi:hypothetical protein
MLKNTIIYYVLLTVLNNIQIYQNVLSPLHFSIRRGHRNKKVTFIMMTLHDY